MLLQTTVATTETLHTRHTCISTTARHTSAREYTHQTVTDGAALDKNTGDRGFFFGRRLPLEFDGSHRKSGQASVSTAPTLSGAFERACVSKNGTAPTD